MSQEITERKHSNDNERTLPPLQELHAIDVVTTDYFDLTSTAKVLMVRLIRWTHGNRAHRLYGHSWAGREKLAKVLDRTSKTTITDAMKELKQADLIIVKRRPNATSLIRPNWDRINRAIEEFKQQEADAEDQKTVLPDDQKIVLPEDQKTGPYSADHYSADLDSALIPGRFAAGMRASVEGDSAYGADRSDFRQTSEEAKQTLDEIKEAWPAPSEHADLQPRHDSDKGASVHYYRLLKSGVPASRIKQAALHFLKSKKEDKQWSRSLASFLTGHLHDYLDPDQPDLYIPQDGEPVATNDNRLPPERKVGGIDWKNDPPF